MKNKGIKKPAIQTPNVIERYTHILLFCSIVLVGCLLLISYILTFIDANVAKNIYLPIRHLIELLHRNWIVLIFIPLVIFYYPIYGVIQNIKEFAGMKFQQAETEEKELSEEETKIFATELPENEATIAEEES